MGLKEIAYCMFHSFFIILSGSLISMYVFKLLFEGNDFIHMNDITALIALSAVTDLTLLIMYSKNELSKMQMLIRYILSFFSVLTIVLLIANFMEWVDLREPMEVIILTISVVAIYIGVITTSFYKTKKLADKLNQKLKERYKG